MSGMPHGGVIGVICDLYLVDHNQRAFAELAATLVNAPHFEDFGEYSLIVHSRSTHSQFYSAFIRRGQDTVECTGLIPPPSAADEELLNEMQSSEPGMDPPE